MNPWEQLRYRRPRKALPNRDNDASPLVIQDFEGALPGAVSYPATAASAGISPVQREAKRGGGRGVLQPHTGRPGPTQQQALSTRPAPFGRGKSLGQGPGKEAAPAPARRVQSRLSNAYPPTQPGRPQAAPGRGDDPGLRGDQRNLHGQ
jgi:hypothetical protein